RALEGPEPDPCIQPGGVDHEVGERAVPAALAAALARDAPIRAGQPEADLFLRLEANRVDRDRIAGFDARPWTNRRAHRRLDRAAVARDRRPTATAAGQDLAAQQAQQHIGRRAVSGVQLETRALE